MSGYLGIQGRNATSYGYAPKLGVGRYAALPRGQQSNALLEAAGGYKGTGTGGRPVTAYDAMNVTPAEMLPIPQATAGNVGGGSGGDGGGDGGNALLGLLPTAAMLAAPYLLRKAKELWNGDPTPQNNPYSALPGDNVTNIEMAAGQGTPAGVSAIPLDAMSVVPGGSLFTASADPFTIGNPNTLVPDLPAGLDGAHIGLPGETGFSGFGGAADVPASVSFADAPVSFGTEVGPPELGAIDPSGLGGGFWSGYTGPLLSSADLGLPNLSVNVGEALGMDLGGFGTIDPFNVGAGAIGSYAAGKVLDQIAPYSSSGFGSGQQIGSSVGGLIAGGLGAIVGGPAGALIGAFLGSLGGGSIGSDEPNFPYAYSGATVGGNGLDFWSPNSLNGGDASGLNPLNNALRDYVTGRMQAEGLAVNPYKGGERALSFGTTAQPGGKFFVGAGDINPSAGAYGSNNIGMANLRAIGPQFGIDPVAATGVWRGDNVADLPGQVWNALTSNGYIGAPGSFSAPDPGGAWSPATTVDNQWAPPSWVPNSANAPAPEWGADDWQSYNNAGAA